MSDQQTTGFQVGANINPFEVAMRRMVESASSAQGQIAGVFQKMNGVMAAAAAALAGGAMLKASVDATQQFTAESNKLARVLGITATEASTLNVALGDIYTDADTFTTAASKMAKELRTNESALQAMGLQTRDSSGNLRPLNDLMMDSIKVVNSYKQGVDRNIAAQQLWGKSAEEVSKLLKLNTEVIEAARQKQEELGLVVGQENVEASKAYKAAMNDVGDVMLAVKKVLGDAVLPILTQLAEMFAAAMPAAVFSFKVAINALATALQGVVLALKVVWDIIRALADPLFVLGSAIRKLISGDMTGAANDMRNIFSSWGNQMAGVWDKVKADSARTWKEVNNLWGQPTAIAPKQDSGRSAKGLVKSDDSLLQKWDAELNAMKQAHADKNAADGTFYEFSKERERQFWVEKRAIVEAGSKSAFGVQAKITAATLEIQKGAFETRLSELQREQAQTEQNFGRKSNVARRELDLVTQRFGAESKQAEDARRKIDDIERAARDQRRQLREIELAETAAAGNQQVDLERQRLQYMYDAGLITRSQQLESEQQFEQQKFTIQSEALTQRLGMVDPNLNPVEYARIKNEILQLELQHQLQLGQLRNQFALENSLQLRGMFSGIQSGWASAMGGVMKGTQTLGQGIRNMFKSVTDAVIDMLAQMAAKWMVQQLMMKIFGKTLAIGKIGEEAAKAGAGGVASMAAAPFPINLSAPAFGAAMSAAAMAFAPVASASQGFDIPAGLNPLTQLHEQEMVLPAKHANVIRSMADGGMGEGALAPTPVDVNVHKMPGDFFMIHRAELVKALTSAHRNFSFK